MRFSIRVALPRQHMQLAMRGASLCWEPRKKGVYSSWYLPDGKVLFESCPLAMPPMVRSECTVAGESNHEAAYDE